MTKPSLLFLIVCASCIACSPQPESAPAVAPQATEDADETSAGIDLVPDEGGTAEPPVAERAPLDLSLPDLDFGYDDAPLPNSRYSEFDPDPLFDESKGKVKTRVSPTFTDPDDPDELPTVDGGKVQVEIQTK